MKEGSKAHAVPTTQDERAPAGKIDPAGGFEQVGSHYNERVCARRGTVMQHRILIADDARTTCDALQKILQAEGTFQVETTGDGKQALEMMLKNSYSLCLTDLRMPGLDGMKLIEEV